MVFGTCKEQRISQNGVSFEQHTRQIIWTVSLHNKMIFLDTLSNTYRIPNVLLVFSLSLQPSVSVLVTLNYNTLV